MKFKGSVKLVLILLFLSSTSAVNVSLANILASADGYEFLIIGPEAYQHCLETFILFKQSLGVSARYVSVEWISKNFQDVDLAWGIHKFVAGEFEKCGIKYLLLVGCYDQVPTRYIYSPSDEGGFANFNYKPSDWFYGVPDWQDSRVGLLEGNIPKIAVGRIPAKNNEELEQTISKIIMVESNPPEGSFLIFQDESLLSKHLIDSSIVLKAQTKDISNDYLIGILSGDVAHTLIYAHGSPLVLWASTFNGSYVPILTVEDAGLINRTYGIHYLVACFAGALDLEDECLARVLMTSKTGPILVVANSRTEALDNPIPSIFWHNFFQTGDVADALIKAITSYLKNSEVFDTQRPLFQKYNLYLCQVVYGDVSWKVRNLEKIVIAHQNSADDPSKTETLGNSYSTSSVSINLFVICIVCVLPVGIYRITMRLRKNKRK
ncbi:MAG: C25 family cysteine peptidase [Candidatus Bathyarchaeia archaeon]